jgi:galactose oxidase-like protein
MRCLSISAQGNFALHLPLVALLGAAGVGCGADDGAAPNDDVGVTRQGVIDTEFGGWNWQFPDAPIQATHVLLMSNDKILAIGGSQANCYYYWGVTSGYFYDAAPGSSGSWTAISGQPPYAGAYDAFCAGHAHDGNEGAVFSGGLTGYGNQNGIGIARGSRYYWGPNSWTQLGNSPQRYYPTLAGSQFGTVYNFAGAQWNGSIWQLGLGAASWSDTGNAHMTTGTYPRVHLLPNGKWFFASPKGPWDGGDRKNYYWNPGTSPGPGDIAGTNAMPTDNGVRTYDDWRGTSVLLPIEPVNGAYPAGKVLIVGGLTSYIKDLSSGNPDWAPVTRTSDGPAQGAEVQFPVRRHNAQATILPTGEVFVSGGAWDQHSEAATKVVNPEIYGNGADLVNWNSRLAKKANYSRNYHSVAVLMRDGRIFTTSGNVDALGSDCDGAWFADGNSNGLPDRRNRAVEIFSPWYVTHPNRPVITSCSANMFSNGVNQTVNIGNGEGNLITKVAILKAGSITHNFDSDQRLVFLDKVSSTSSTVTYKTPYSHNAAPYGSYMLFVYKTVSWGGYNRLLPSVGCWTLR